MTNQIDLLPDLPDDADYSRVKLAHPWCDESTTPSGYFHVKYNDVDYRSQVCNRRTALKGR